MRLTILGAGETGAGTAILARKKGYDVFVSDAGPIADKYKQMLQDHAIAWEEGGHTPELVLHADSMVKSPGIPPDAPMPAQAAQRGIPILSEIEFASRYTDAKMVCITGSNGKTTTTKLIHHILTRAGYDAALAGNVGRSMALQVAEGKHDWYVLELSSFQLENMYNFRADIAVVLNITPDHLDRYGYRIEPYAEAKMRIGRNQREQDSLIYWRDDEHVPALLRKSPTPAQELVFADTRGGRAVAYVKDGVMTVERPSTFFMPVADLSLRGRHNVRNCMAATLAALAARVPREAIKSALADFPHVPHRLEPAGEADGITYINDSKATNVDACFYALDAMTTPVILILGGLDKGNDYSQIIPLVKEKCRALVYLGADNSKLHDTFDSLGLPVSDTGSMAECLEACRKVARKGDTVLLSPCCASFDLFNGMAERGNLFKQGVSELANQKPAE
ncbi:MAG: UDP-N-acetylmuramoyl-L-alanine--D-glutamate ligase [Bacteroidaceae bacterium]|nr:UDP-N-acetylmuramoyl-L-alanine--D-glutamate ligase [Bacteroidaceae bacterium]